MQRGQKRLDGDDDETVYTPRLPADELPINLLRAPEKFTRFGPALLVLDPCGHRLDNWPVYSHAVPEHPGNPGSY